MSNREFIVVIILRSPKVETVMKSRERERASTQCFCLTLGCIQTHSLVTLAKRRAKESFISDGCCVCATWNHFMLFYGWRANLNFKSIRMRWHRKCVHCFGHNGRLIRVERSESKCQKGMKINAASLRNTKKATCDETDDRIFSNNEITFRAM